MTNITVSNLEFLKALFGNDAPWVHVTAFTHDPSAVPDTEHLIAWKGDYFSRYGFPDISNQYFTISLFYADEHQTARRRKALYRSTPVIVLDDVKEKLHMEEVEKLPRPSWILETSPGSEQWGYILDTPCTDRYKVENLLDGLVANGLAPGGRDPGMKGVTRYVRLPEGYNTKKAKMINGQPWLCKMTLWDPTHTTTMEELAKPFMVDLEAVRREARVDGAADVGDHPLLNLTDIIHIKEVRSDGRFDITCPWVNDHTDASDSGSAVFTNGDGSIGFKCHHGACQERTGKHLLSLIEQDAPGFRTELGQWQAIRAFKAISDATPPVPQILPPVGIPPDFTQPVDTSIEDHMFMDQGGRLPAAPIQSPGSQEPVVGGYQQLIDMLRKEPPFTDQSRALSSQILKSVDSLAAIERLHLHDQIRDIMRWSKPDFKHILDSLRQEWYIEGKADISFFDDVVFIAEQNQFFDRKKRIFFTAEAYQNMYSHLDPEARKEALQGGRVTKVDKLDYAPLRPAVFEERGLVFGNSWHDNEDHPGTQGDVTRWIDHFDALGWEDERDHILKWLAYTVRHPDKKINHMLIFGSGEGGGKDWLLYPLVKAMGENHTTISGDELLGSFNDYLMSTKYLHINEAELGDHREATVVSNKLKPLAAAPPDTLRVNIKSVTPIKVRNIVNCTMTTNSQVPVKLNGMSRRYFAVWSDLNVRDETYEMLPAWQDYWKDRWEWMEGPGADACIWYLKNVVDLTNFNPAAAPPMTDFLREIAEASKSPLQQTIEAFLREKIGVMSRDILTSDGINTCLKQNQDMAKGLIYLDMRYITPVRIAQVLKSDTRIQKVQCKECQMWIVRNHDKYKGMAPEQIYEKHLEQVQVYQSSVPLSVVGE